MIRIWTDRQLAGVLDRNRLADGTADNRRLGSTFVYQPEAPPERAVSLTMPVRLASWNTAYGVAPIFEMNLPEGALRERLRLAFAKATGSFDDLDMLSIVGRSQLGRIRFTAMDATLDEDVPSSPSMRFSPAGAAASYTVTSSRSLPSTPASAVCSPSS